jgi:hypothetical protein
MSDGDVAFEYCPDCDGYKGTDELGHCAACHGNLTVLFVPFDRVREKLARRGLFGWDVVERKQCSAAPDLLEPICAEVKRIERKGALQDRVEVFIGQKSVGVLTVPFDLGDRIGRALCTGDVMLGTAKKLLAEEPDPDARVDELAKQYAEELRKGIARARFAAELWGKS